MGNVFHFKNLVSSGRKICYYARKQKFCNIASPKKNKSKERGQPYPSSVIDMVDEYAGGATRN